MTYFEGFIVAVPLANKEAYRKHAADAAPIFTEFGVTRHVEAWGSDVAEGKVTDFRRAVQAQEGEEIVFSWFEYPSKAVRDAAQQRMMTDPRMEEMGASMPFDGKRMIYGGFELLLEQGTGTGAYVDGFVLPVPHANKQAYRAMAEKASAIFAEYGALRLIESFGDDIPDGKVTDFRRSVRAKEDENVVFSWIEWPDKATRDAAWPKMMADERMQPDHASMPFDGMRMFWGGFEILLDHRGQRENQSEPALA
jgi:uncharacterized protein YbaA (DUF1428 family)